MGYKNDSMMDCGYYIGGHPGGLIYIPPAGSADREPSLIPWSHLLPDEPDNESDDTEQNSGT